MNAPWRWSAPTSAKRVEPTGAGSTPSRTRTTHTAMVARSIASSGQNPASQPVPANTPSPASAPTAGAYQASAGVSG